MQLERLWKYISLKCNVWKIHHTCTFMCKYKTIYDVVIHYITLYDNVWCCITLYYTLWQLYYTTLHFTIMYDAVLHYITLYDNVHVWCCITLMTIYAIFWQYMTVVWYCMTLHDSVWYYMTYMYDYELTNINFNTLLDKK